MRLRQRMSIKISGNKKKSLISVKGVFSEKRVHITIIQNKKVIGKIKDEAAGQITTEFVGLRLKM